MTEPDRGATKGRTPAADSRDSANDSPAPDRNSHRLPAVSLPKGGGAIHGMGEKFGTNPATGTGSMSIPLPSSPARGEFGPKLSLNYDSASGNGSSALVGASGCLPSPARPTRDCLVIVMRSPWPATMISRMFSSCPGPRILSQFSTTPAIASRFAAPCTRSTIGFTFTASHRGPVRPESALIN
ncbi:MAG: repeat-associated core protein [Candidatus Solibacter sp.]|nr:repeat-associated core protein [Candidatus Solibacter sp.]